MISYVHNMTAFMSNTTVHEAMHCWPRGKIRHDGFSQLWIKLTPNDPSTYTLKELNDFRTNLCRMLRFSTILVNLGWLEPSSSIDAVWLVPTGMVHELTEVILMADKYFHEERIQMILLDETLIYLHASIKGKRCVHIYMSVL